MSTIEFMDSMQRAKNVTNHSGIMDNRKYSKGPILRKCSTPVRNCSLNFAKVPFYPPPILHTLQHNSALLDEGFFISKRKLERSSSGFDEKTNVDLTTTTTAANVDNSRELITYDSMNSVYSSGFESIAAEEIEEEGDEEDNNNEIRTICENDDIDNSYENTRKTKPPFKKSVYSFDSGTYLNESLTNSTSDILQTPASDSESNNEFLNSHEKMMKTSKNRKKYSLVKSLNKVRALSLPGIGFSKSKQHES